MLTENSYNDMKTLSVSDVMNRNFQYLNYKEDYYSKAQNVFSGTEIRYLPVLNDDRRLMDIMTLNRAFYKKRFQGNELPRMSYAYGVWNAVGLAKVLGIRKISVMEFGVAGGNGLVNLEFHANEISRLTGIEIEVYGFDSGKGLLESSEEKDASFNWSAGDYPMDIDLLKKP